MQFGTVFFFDKQEELFQVLFGQFRDLRGRSERLNDAQDIFPYRVRYLAHFRGIFCVREHLECFRYQLLALMRSIEPDGLKFFFEIVHTLLIFSKKKIFNVAEIMATVMLSAMEPESATQNAIGRILTAVEVAGFFALMSAWCGVIIRRSGASGLDAPYGSMKIA
ncbi:MAG: hypothetical protein FWH34_07680 [Desulfovibrionaceae bacterium]|nr:hypothetical protein [Desulfovibrionaceae bacterium]